MQLAGRTCKLPVDPERRLIDMCDGALRLPRHCDSGIPIVCRPPVWNKPRSWGNKPQHSHKAQRFQELNNQGAKILVVIMNVNSGVFVEWVNEHHSYRLARIKAVVYADVEPSDSMPYQYVRW